MKIKIVRASAFVSGAIGRYMRSQHDVPNAEKRLERAKKEVLRAEANLERAKADAIKVDDEIKFYDEARACPECDERDQSGKAHRADCSRKR